MNEDTESWGGIDPADVIRRSHEAFVVMDEAGIVRVWNDAAQHMFGFDRAAAVGERLSELIIPPRYRELHERGLRSYLDTGVGPVLGSTIEIDGVDRDGRAVPVELTISATAVEGQARFYAFLNDVTHRRRTERFLRADARLGWSFAQRPGRVGVDAVLAAIGEEMVFAVGLAWLPDESGRLQLAGSWSPTDAAAAFALDSEAFSFARGEGVPGATWESGEPTWYSDLAAEATYLRRPSAARVGFRSGLFVPIGRGRACHGVLEFLTSEWRGAGDDLLERFARLGERVGSRVGGR